MQIMDEKISYRLWQKAKLGSGITLSTVQLQSPFRCDTLIRVEVLVLLVI